MSLSENIVNFRKENNLSQEGLAQKIGITRQSVSKWENGETLPSIDNLIVLSGLFNISLDELITGEPYLYFPFDFGRPKNKKPVFLLVFFSAFLLFAALLFLSQYSELMGNPLLVVGIVMLLCIFIYIFTVYNFWFDYKRYYTYWSLQKNGIEYPAGLRSDGILSHWDDFILPIKAALGLKKRKFILYSDIQSIELIFIPFKANPDRVRAAISPDVKSFRYAFMPRPRIQHLVSEAFYYKVTTKAGEVFSLDLKSYYNRHYKEHKYLPTVIAFLQRKQFDYVDEKQISHKILKREDCWVQKYYQENTESF